jgi:hypothetical protein
MEYLGLRSGHGGPDYEQLVFDGRMVLQLHRWGVHDHPHLGDPTLGSNGNGVVLWFQTEDIERAFEQALAREAEILETLELNTNANHREFWLRDPDGYVLVVAGMYGDIG